MHAGSEETAIIGKKVPAMPLRTAASIPDITAMATGLLAVAAKMVVTKQKDHVEGRKHRQRKR